MSPVAVRLQRFRQRQACGRVCLTIEVDEIAVTEVLIAAGVLSPGVDHGRGELERAVERLLAALSQEHETRFNASAEMMP
jgi:hypothetical protein